MYWKGKMYMDYTEFKRKYPFATKNYPDTMSLPFNSDKFIGSMTKTKQIKKTKANSVKKKKRQTEKKA